jgi:hypothetical protein
MGALKEKGFSLDQVKRVPYKDAFLIGELLTSRITILAGEPKTGKTLLAVGMVTALLKGDSEFLGLPIHRRVERVVFGLTDDGAKEELHERFAGQGINESRIRGFLAEDADTDAYWTELTQDLVDHGTDLFVFDNILGGLGRGEDISSSVTAASIIRNLRQVASAGIPVLAVTHTAKGTSEGLSVASSPIGGRAIAGGARGIIALRFSKSGGRVIETAINRARENLNLPVSVARVSEDSEAPVWTVRQQGKTQAPKQPSAADRAAEMAAHILDVQPEETSVNAVSLRYAEQFGWAPETARRPLKKLIKHDGSLWVPVGEVEAEAAGG